MKTAAPDPSLTEEEFDRLSALLDQAGPDAMNIEMLDGFFAALICGPDLVPPSEYLPEIWGEDFVFESDEQVNVLLGLLMKHWNAVADGLQRSLGAESCYRLVLLQDASGKLHGNDWAKGFFRGMRLRPYGWDELMGGDVASGPLLPIVLLYGEHHPDHTLRAPQITDDIRETILTALAANLTDIYRHFEQHRRDMTRIPQPVQQRRMGAKIGRNDPCPCGSGKKYKQCCSRETSMH